MVQIIEISKLDYLIWRKDLIPLNKYWQKLINVGANKKLKICKFKMYNMLKFNVWTCSWEISFGIEKKSSIKSQAYGRLLEPKPPPPPVGKGLRTRNESEQSPDPNLRWRLPLLYSLLSCIAWSLDSPSLVISSFNLEITESVIITQSCDYTIHWKRQINCSRIK